jgi:hypothetical protein
MSSFRFACRKPYFNLKAAVEREKAVQAIDGHRKCKNGVVTFLVMSQFSHLQGGVQTFVIQLLALGLTPGITQEGKVLAEKPEESGTKGSRNNNFPFWHPTFRPAWADLHSHNP